MAGLINIPLLFLEAAIYFLVMATLFRARHRLGIGLFFCALGAMHFLETYLAAILYVELPGGIALSPGSVVLFSGKLLMLLLVYIREDAAVVRQPIYGLLIGNFMMVALVFLMRYHVLDGETGRMPDFVFMDQMGWLMVGGTLMLFLDSLMIVLLYERLGSWLSGRPVLRILTSAVVVLTFDQIGFFLLLYFVVDLPAGAFWGGWIAKMVAAIFYSLAISIYLRTMEWPRRSRRQRLSDVFDVLTYRERYERLMREAGRDALTGLKDRGCLDREGARVISRAVRQKRPASLLIVDIDHFKQINDVHGHAAGDDVLRAVARELRVAVREGDEVYRYGGEEFVVVCDGLAHEAAVQVAERIRRSISLLALPGLPEQVTASIGVSTAPEDGAGLGMLFVAADGRLYDAKSGGRNRVKGAGSVAVRALA